MTPERRRTLARIFTELSLSFRMMAERKMVTTGQEKMMQRASGTSMKDTQARAVMNVVAPASPDKLKDLVL